MKNQKGFANVVLIGLVVALLAIGGYFVWKGKQKSVVSESMTINTADWKTYTNSNPAFSFNYPASWKGPTINQQSTRILYDFNDGFSVTTGIYYNQEKQRNNTITEIVDAYKKENIKNLQSKNIVVDGHNAVELTYSVTTTSNGIDATSKDADVWIYQDNQVPDKLIEINSNDSIDSATFDQILYTFKFIK